MPDSGQVLSHYEILRPLGKGGMGEVFLAEDTVLGRKVALKFLPDEAAADPTARGRFLREAKSAAALDDPFICKVYETGEVDGRPFIAMEYVEGESLHERLSRGALSLEETLKTASEVAEALGVAHEHGIIHRDLKPSNIMLTRQGHAKVLDFGLAKQVIFKGQMDSEAETATSEDLTAYGTTLGTLAYMSPEQLRAEPLGPRSDVFSFGVVLHELLTGKHPFSRPSTAETIKAIMSEEAPPLGNEGVVVPQTLVSVVGKALEKDPLDRYSSAQEVANELSEIGRTLAPAKKARPVLAVVAAAVVAAVGVGGGVWLTTRGGNPAPTEAPPPLSVLVADFENNTGEEVFDGALEQAVAIGLESASFVNCYSRGRARQVAGEIQSGADKLDADRARLVAHREAINVLVLGSISGSQGEYRLEIDAVDGINGESLAAHAVEVTEKDGVLEALADLVVQTRRSLGDTVPESVQLAAKETFTAGSLEAAAAYSRAQDLMGVGRWADAIEEYRRAVQIDPDLGRAYAGAAVCYANMGRSEEAGEQFQQAMAHIDRMTNREKYRSRGAYYLMTRNFGKAADEYSALVAEYPYDAAGLNNLPLAHFYGRNMALAVEEGRRAVETYPDHLMPRANLALYSLYAGDFSSASTQAATVLETNPSYELAYVVLALTELGQGNIDAAIGHYESLRAVSAWGASLAASGLADVALYQGRLQDAVGMLQQGIRGDRAADNEGEAARKLAVLAQTLAALGEDSEAVAAADEAVASSRRENVLYPAALVYLDLGHPDKATAIADDFGSRLGPDPQVYSRLITAEAALKNGQPQPAIALAGEAQQILDTWPGRFLLGRAYLEAGAFPEAHSELERCLERRGEAAALFLDDVPTYRYLPAVHYWLGRALEGLGSPAAAESYRTYLEIRRGADADPLSVDSRKRVGSD